LALWLPAAAHKVFLSQGGDIARASRVRTHKAYAHNINVLQALQVPVTKRMRSDPSVLRSLRSRAQRDSGAMLPPPEPQHEQPGIMMLLPMVAQLAVFADGGIIGVWSRCTQAMLNSPATRALFRVALRMWGNGLRVHTLAPLLQLQAQIR
jgi:hypothetical protein